MVVNEMYHLELNIEQIIVLFQFEHIYIYSKPFQVRYVNVYNHGQFRESYHQVRCVTVLPRFTLSECKYYVRVEMKLVTTL